VNCAFPKTIRLRHRKQYQRVMRHSTRFIGQWIIVEISPNNGPNSRLGITASRHYGDAHERNRFKRIVREAFRISYHMFPKGYDLNVKPRSSAKEASRDHILGDLVAAFNAITDPNGQKDNKDNRD
jgi:ribonuclease P protein component